MLSKIWKNNVGLYNQLLWIALFALIGITNQTLAQTCSKLGQNPSTAFPVCATGIFSQATVPACGGRDIPVPQCTPIGYTDINPYWYKFTCFTAGTLGFTITPVNLNDDYDWQIFDITGRNPDDVYDDISLFVTCNWSGESGKTGASAAGNSQIVCGGFGQDLYSEMATLIQGHHYIMLVSHFTDDNQSGYTLQFGGGTANITDGTPPGMIKATTNCVITQVGLKLNKNMKCTSLAPNGTDFKINPPNASIVSAVAYNCNNSFDMDSLTLTLSNPLPPGLYQLVAKNGTDGNSVLDNCGAGIPENDFIVIDLLPPPQPTTGSNSPVCNEGNIELTSNYINNATYSWVGPNGFTSSLQNPILTHVGMIHTGVYSVTATTSNGCQSTPGTTSVEIAQPTIPLLDISASNNDVCPNTSITFTATPTTGGTKPTYQWKLNGINTGTNSATYTSNNFTNNDNVLCIMTSNAFCVKPTTAISNTITMNIRPAVVPALSITADDNGVCIGTTITFMATPVNEGSSPKYQWKVNGVNKGTNSLVFLGTGLRNGDLVTCELKSNATCVFPSTILSNTIEVEILPLVKPEVIIAASTTNEICAGIPVTFIATPLYGGATPAYDWKINGTSTGITTKTFTTNTITNNDLVTCVMTSSASCPNPEIVPSNVIKVKVNALAIPSVSITSEPTTACAGNPVTFYATPLFAGNSPIFQWKLNGANTGLNSTTYSNSQLKNGDVVACTLTSNATCIATNTAVSNTLSIPIMPLTELGVSISSSTNEICAGQEVIFVAIPTNGGSKLIYQWYVNGNNTGNHEPVHATSNLHSNAEVYCTITSAEKCLVQNTVPSNKLSIQVNPLPLVSLGPDKTIVEGQRIQLNATVEGNISKYLWSPPTYLNSLSVKNPVANPVSTTTYILQATNVDNCVNTDDIIIKVVKKVEIPNAFSPNGDGVNDTWTIPNLPDYEDCSVDVFDRYGMLVFKSLGYNKPWDGTRSGKPVPVGVYYYIIKSKLFENPLTGSVTLIR